MGIRIGSAVVNVADPQVERLVGLGATKVREHVEPEGNEFCVCSLPSI